MIPLPPRVYLTAETAEGRAHEIFRSFAEQAPQMTEMAEALADGDIRLRTLLVSGASLKEKMGRLTDSEETVRLVRHARLAHWVWVVEAHESSFCSNGDGCVRAAAVFDSTAYDHQPSPAVLLMPGSGFVYPPDDGRRVEVNIPDKAWRSLLNVH